MAVPGKWRAQPSLSVRGRTQYPPYYKVTEYQAVVDQWQGSFWVVRELIWLQNIFLPHNLE